MNAAYFKAAIPEPFRILGLRLLPLSLGRYRLLKRFENAFVAEGEATAEVGDLLTGVLICSMRCDQFLNEFESPGFDKQIRKWSRSICPRPWLSLISKKHRDRHSFNLHEKLALFKRYIDEGSEMPKYFDESPGDSVSGAHWSHSVEVTLRSELGWGEEEINESPLTKAFADYFKFAESQGLIQLMTDEQLQQGEANAKIYEQMLAGGLN